jgi:hypothetical protein
MLLGDGIKLFNGQESGVRTVRPSADGRTSGVRSFGLGSLPSLFWVMLVSVEWPIGEWYFVKSQRCAKHKSMVNRQ